MPTNYQYGRVSDKSTGIPLCGAILRTLDGRTSTTDALGLYSFSAPVLDVPTIEGPVPHALLEVAVDGRLPGDPED